jgi:hypothetical protein
MEGCHPLKSFLQTLKHNSGKDPGHSGALITSTPLDLEKSLESEARWENIPRVRIDCEKAGRIALQGGDGRIPRVAFRRASERSVREN